MGRDRRSGLVGLLNYLAASFIFVSDGLESAVGNRQRSSLADEMEAAPRWSLSKGSEGQFS